MLRSVVLMLCITASGAAWSACSELLNFETQKLRSQEMINFCEAFESKVLLVVNTASRCGFTPQFKELEALYGRYKEQGLVIVGFPSNDFKQEFSNEDKVADVCYVNYGVSFPMVAISSVKGRSANKMFQRLAKATGQHPQWNFNKYLISSDGSRVQHFASQDQPLGGKIEAAVRDLL